MSEILLEFQIFSISVFLFFDKVTSTSAADRLDPAAVDCRITMLAS